jgi:hypothetical protein
MLERRLDGFVGKLTTSKGAALTKFSQDTALRDVEALVARGILVRDKADGRSASYSLGEASPPVARHGTKQSPSRPFCATEHS